jgi:hypothetical protein
MIKVGLSTRNKYIMSDMEATVLVQVFRQPPHGNESGAVQVTSDWLRSCDRGLGCSRRDTAAGVREDVGTDQVQSGTGAICLPAA